MTGQKGHGIPDSLMKEVRNLTRKFFELPYEEKIKIKMTPATGYRSARIYSFQAILHCYNPSPGSRMKLYVN